MHYARLEYVKAEVHSIHSNKVFEFSVAVHSMIRMYAWPMYLNIGIHFFRNS